MLNISKKTKVISASKSGQLDTSIFLSKEPIIIKGLVDTWQLVKLGKESNNNAIDYLKSHYNGRPSMVAIGEPGIEGRFFYNEQCTDLNFVSKKAKIDDVLDLITKELNKKKPISYYIASNVIDTHFPSFRSENDIEIPRPKTDFPAEDMRTSIWIGNSTTACCHYDTSDNLACCVVGKRKFTLFPPDQIRNLYPGPLTPTPGGRALSMVDFEEPDLQKHPKFSEAIKHGQIAELEAGDALYLPSMWWHQVESQSEFNVLVNYWWSESSKFMGTSMNVLYHAMLSLRDKPEHEKKAWKNIFDYYIFDDLASSTDHIPNEAKGFLEKLDDKKARALRSMLINLLNR